jgi:hypothetical protein
MTRLQNKLGIGGAAGAGQAHAERPRSSALLGTCCSVAARAKHGNCPSRDPFSLAFDETLRDSMEQTQLRRHVIRENH